MKNVKEIIEKRGLSRKVFEAEDGSGYVEISSAPIHFMKNGKYEEIDTTIRKTDDGYYGESGEYEVRFSSGEEAVTCSFGDKSVTWVPECKGRRAELVELPDKKPSLKYSGKNDDLDYELGAGRLKERIVIKRPLEKYEYSFSMTLRGVSPDAKENGDISFTDTKGKEVFRIPKGYMYDSIGRRSDDVKFGLTEKEGSYRFTIIPDPDWINSEETAFPVVIDPEMYFNEMLNTGISYVNTKPGRDGPYAELSTIGEQQIIHISNISLDISSLPDDAVITGATLNLKQLSDNIPGFSWQLADIYSNLVIQPMATGSAGQVIPIDVDLPVILAAENGRSNCSLMLMPYLGNWSEGSQNTPDPDCEFPEDQNVPGQGYIEFDALQSTFTINLNYSRRPEGVSEI